MKTDTDYTDIKDLEKGTQINDCVVHGARVELVCRPIEAVGRQLSVGFERHSGRESSKKYTCVAMKVVH